MSIDADYVNERFVAEMARVPLLTIEGWVNDGTLPAPVKVRNGRRYWHRVAIREWWNRRLDVELATLDAHCALLVRRYLPEVLARDTKRKSPSPACDGQA
jgi:predicted DNA-binding transcriptional regulator AlpA